MNFRLLSWNVHGLPAPLTKQRSTRLARIALRIMEEQPDFVALQEVWAGSVRLLVDALPGYVPCFVRARPGSTTGGLLCFVRRARDWRVVDGSLRFRIYSDFAPRHRVWEADGIAGKGALMIAVEHADGERLWLVDTHLQARYTRDSYARIRAHQLGELSGWIAELGTSSTILLAGDFNTPSEDEIYREVAALGEDITRQARSASGAFTNYPTHASAAWIDYVLVRPRAGSTASGQTRLILNREADDPFSDHHGLVCDIDVAPLAD